MAKRTAAGRQGKDAESDLRKRRGLRPSRRIPARHQPLRRGPGPLARRAQDVAGKRDVAILAIEPVGNYAAKIEFDDTHSTGLYTWDYLYQLGANQTDLWKAYLNELTEKGLSR